MPAHLAVARLVGARLRGLHGRGQGEGRAAAEATMGPGSFWPAVRNFCGSWKTPWTSTSKCRCGPVEAAGGADFGDFLAALDQVALFDQHARGVGITRDEFVAVVDLDHVAVGRVVFLRDDDAARGGQDGRARFRTGNQAPCAAPSGRSSGLCASRKASRGCRPATGSWVGTIIF